MVLVTAALLTAFAPAATAATHRHAAAHHPAAPAFHQDTTRLPAAVIGGHTTAGTAISGTSSGEIIRTIVGLAVVLGVIYGLYWLLRSAGRARSSRGDERMVVVATTPLAQNRALHLVRAGGELILLGASEHAITPIRVYPGDDLADTIASEPDGVPALDPPAPLQRGLVGLVEGLRRLTVRA